MISYIIRRLLVLPIVLIGVTILIFAMLQLLSPTQRLSTFISDPTALKQGRQQVEQMIEKYGLNDPIPVQYFRWMKNLIQGDLGWSESASLPVLKAILRYLPATLELALLAILPTVLGGIWLGVISAVHQDSPLDHSTRVMAITGWSFPTFVFGLLVLMIFYGMMSWFPPGRLSTWANQLVHSSSFVRYTGMNTLDALLNGNLRVFWDAVRHLVLPVITLAYVQWALILRIMRSSMLETLRQDYVTTARAKGLKEGVVIKKHGRRNALIPVATIAGLMAIGLLNGVIIVEVVFNYRGLGYLSWNAAVHLDIPMVLGFTLFNALLMVVVNLMVDISYAFIDPRVRLQ